MRTFSGLRLSLLTAACALALAPAAQATDPHDIVSPGGKWASGDLIQQIGENCSVIGSPYTETMVSGIGDYGGAASGGVAKVGQRYYTSLLLSVPGNPCGPGSSGIATDVILPRGTSVDTSAPIRCFGQPRNTTNIEDLTNANWNFNGSTGRYCPTSLSPSSRHSGALFAGYRPIASGQLFWIFVPVLSTQVLSGSSTNDRFVWVTDATGVYENPGASSVWSWVFDAGAPSAPFVYFTRNPHPFWKADAPQSPDSRNRVEFWANFYTGGQAGNVCFQITKVPSNTLVATCASAPGWNGTVGAGNDYVQVLPGAGEQTGPEGGYVPFSYDAPPAAEWDQNMRITWTFTPSGGSPVSNSQDFHTLPGPDTDGDGVADAADSCPSVNGTLANGCMPAAQDDPDHDGVYGSADTCPGQDGMGALDGCPAQTSSPAAPPADASSPPAGASSPPAGATTTVAPAALKAAFAPATGPKLSRHALLARAGLGVKISCTRAARATLRLTVSAKVAKKLGLPKRTRTLAAAGGNCSAGKRLTLVLKPGGKVLARLKRARGAFAATLRLALKAQDGTAATAAKLVRVT
jgi:hypothetical protein